MGMLAKIRRMHYRDHLPLREIARLTGLSRNTVREWLRRPDQTEPQYPSRTTPSVLDPYKEQLLSWLKTDSHRPRRDRRTIRFMFLALQAQGYSGSYDRVVAFIRQCRQAENEAPKRQAYVPMRFRPGEAFQFDWSCEYASIGGQRKRLEVAHIKLAFSRAFLLVAYLQQSHEMLFDAHARGFAAFGGIARRGIYDNMKTAVDKVGAGKLRNVNARFQAMCGHYLFEADFCNRAAGWEKGIVEKNVQDRRRQLGQELQHRRWASLAEINAWLLAECQAAWTVMSHPDCPELTVAAALEDERAQLMPCPRPFDGYVARTVRVSSTALIHFQRNHYSVPVEHAHHLLTLRIYPDTLVLVADNREVARHVRSFERYQMFYDWQHYIPLLQRKPGALRNGAPFAGMPEPFLQLQHYLLKRDGGDRIMAQVLAVIPEHGVEAVQVAVELALSAGRPSGEHILNILARLKSPGALPMAETPLALSVESLPNVQRYDALSNAAEVPHVD